MIQEKHQRILDIPDLIFSHRPCLDWATRLHWDGDALQVEKKRACNGAGSNQDAFTIHINPFKIPKPGFGFGNLFFARSLKFEGNGWSRYIYIYVS